MRGVRRSRIGAWAYAAYAGVMPLAAVAVAQGTPQGAQAAAEPAAPATPAAPAPPAAPTVPAAPPVVSRTDGNAAAAARFPFTTFSPEDEALHRQRFDRLMQAARTGAGLDQYDFMEPVPGAARHAWLPAARPGRGTVRPDALEAARAYAERMNSNALLVWRDGKLEAAHYFRGNDASTPIVSRSLAKPLTAVAIGRAIELGKIRSLDQPVADFVTEWRDDPRRSRILVRHLLDMRSGFLAQGVSPDPDHILNRAYLHPRHDEVIIRDYPVVDEPGTRYEYNNAISEMVAPVIERATGRRYAEFVSTEILQPIGALGGEVWVNRPGGTAHSGCCILLPPETWLRLGILLLDDGRWEGRRLLPKGYVTAMTTGTADYAYYGLGVYVAGPYKERRGWANPERTGLGPGVLHSEPYLARDLFLFDGNANQVVYVVPSERLVIVRTGGNPPRKDGAEWDNAFLPNTVMRGLERRRSQKAPEPQPR